MTLSFFTTLAFSAVIAVGVINLTLHFYAESGCTIHHTARSFIYRNIGRSMQLWMTSPTGFRALVLFALLLMVAGLAIGNFTNFEMEKLGQTGDYMGGWLNPLVGLLTIYLLTRTLTAQATSVKLQKRAAEQADKRAKEMLILQRVTTFENGLFNINAAYRSNLSQLTKTLEDENWNGAAALEQILHEDFFVPVRKALGHSVFALNDAPKMNAKLRQKLLDVKPKLVDEWRLFLVKSPMLKSLLSQQMQLFRWIDRQELLSEQERREYSAAIRAQLSRGEVLLWHFHLLVEGHRKEAHLIDKFGLFALMGDQKHPIQKLCRRILFVEKTIGLSAYKWSGKS